MTSKYGGKNEILSGSLNRCIFLIPTQRCVVPKPKYKGKPFPWRRLFAEKKRRGTLCLNVNNHESQKIDSSQLCTVNHQARQVDEKWF